MTLIRARQNPITTVFPHNANRRFIVPSRAGIGNWPGEEDITAVWDFRTKSLEDLRGGLTYGFDRNSTATYVGASGLIETAAIDEPRFEHYGDGRFRGLLLEDASENVALHSEDITNPHWFPNRIAPSIAAGIVGPDGALGVSFAEETAETGVHSVSQAVAGSIPDNAIVTASCWIKDAGRQSIAISCQIKSGISVTARWTAATGALEGEFGVISSSSEAYPNGWFRVSTTFDVGTGGSVVRLGLQPQIDTTVSYPGEPGKGVYLWGAQYEVQDGATSYMPTAGGAVSRANEDCVTPTSPVPSLAAFSWYMEAEPFTLTPVALGDMGGLGAATGTFDVFFYRQVGGAGLLRFSSLVGGAVDMGMNGNQPLPPGRVVVSSANPGESRMFQNGAFSASDTAASVPALNQATRLGGNQHPINKVQRMHIRVNVFYSRLLTDDEARFITNPTTIPAPIIRIQPVP